MGLGASLFACGETPNVTEGGFSGAGVVSSTPSDTDFGGASASDGKEDSPIPEVMPLSGTLLFQNDGEGIYNYCPAVLQEEDGTRYLYYCTNQSSYDITDYIACRKGTPDGTGAYLWGEETVVLSPTAGTWDARHVCDPSVIAGTFAYKGDSYSYLMAYLGCTSEDNQENKIGLALAKTPMGPFVKVGNAPFVDFQKDPAVPVFQWGVGQPSLVNLNGEGRVALFYTQGDKDGTRLMAGVYDFSEAEAVKTETSPLKISEQGLKNLENKPDFFNNGDVALSQNMLRLYIASDTHPNPAGTPDYISGAFRVNEAGFRGVSSLASVSWKSTATVGQAQTSFPRNHNVGLVRDRYGKLPTETYLTVYYTVAEAGENSLWTYRLYEWSLPLN